MAKPQVFMSHAHEDKPLIKRIASDLLECGIQPWVDQWEIPTGTSFRRRIFEEGLPDCDVLFVYLSPAAAKSYWVSRELDAGFVKEAEGAKGCFALFVDCDSTRGLLSVDMRSLHIPVFQTKGNGYARSLTQLTKRVLDVSWSKCAETAMKDQRLQLLESQTRVSELEREKDDLTRTIRPEEILLVGRIQQEVFEVDGVTCSLGQVFERMAGELALGTSYGAFGLNIAEMTGPEESRIDRFSTPENRALYHRLLGRLVIYGLVRVQPNISESHQRMRGFYDRADHYYLTERGAAVARAMLEAPRAPIVR